MVKLLAIIAGLLVAVSGLDVIPFLSPELGVMIIGFTGALVGVVMKIGDYLDDKKFNDSFVATKIPGFKFVVDFLKGFSAKK